MKFEIPFKGKNYDWNVEIVTNDSTASAATLDPARNVNLRFGSPGGYDVSGAILTSNFQLEVLDPDSTLYSELYDIQDDGSVSVLLYTTDTAETYKWKGYVRLDTMDRTIAPDVNTPVVAVYCYDGLTRLKDDQEIFGITGSKTGSRDLLRIIAQAMQAVRREKISTYDATASAVGDMYVEYLFDVDTGIFGNTLTDKFIESISLKDSTYYGEDGLEGDPYKVLEEILENFDIKLFQRTLNTQPIVNNGILSLGTGATIDFPRWAAYKRSLFGTAGSVTDRKADFAYYDPLPESAGTQWTGTIGYAATAITADDIRVDGRYVRRKPLKAVTVDTKITDFSLEETTITRGVGLGTAVTDGTVTLYDYTDYWGTAGTANLISAGTYVDVRGAAASVVLAQDSLVVGTGFRTRIHVAMESQGGGDGTSDYLLVRVKDAGTAAIGAATIFVPIGGTERATIGAGSYGFYNTQLVNDGTQGTAPTTAADLTASVTAQLRVEIEYPTTFGGATIVDAGGTKTANSAALLGDGTARVKSVSVFLENYSGNVGSQKKSWKAEMVNDNVQIGDKVELKSAFSNILLERNALDPDQPNFFTVDGFSGTFYDIAQLFAQAKMVGYQKPRDVLDIELMGLYPPELPLQYTNSGGSTTTFIVGGGIELDLVNETTKGTWVELTTSDESDPLIDTTPTDPGTIVP